MNVQHKQVFSASLQSWNCHILPEAATQLPLTGLFVKIKNSESGRLCLLSSYAGLAVNLVRLGSLQPGASAWAPVQLLSVQPHMGIGCFFAHILRALALWLCRVLPEKRERWWRMPGALPHPPPVLPAQIRQRVCEGRRGEKEEVDRDHVSVPSVPPFPQCCTNLALQWDWAILEINPDLQNWTITPSNFYTPVPHTSQPPGEGSLRTRPSLSVSLSERGHERNPNKLSWLHYDPETVK